MIVLRFLSFLFMGLVLASCMTTPTNTPPPPPTQTHDEHAHHTGMTPPPCTPPEGQMAAKPLPYVVDLKPLTPLAANKPASFEVHILNQQAMAVKHQTFRVMHGKRVHTLVVDPSLTDYQHLHLRPDNPNGLAVYQLKLTPKQTGHYKIYLDVVDQSNEHYFLEAGFTVPGPDRAPSFDKTLGKGNMQTEAQAQGLSFITQVSSPVRSKEHVMLSITVKQGNQLFRKLEPVMQAYAHLVGFNADRSELIHAHPMGEEPRSSNQRGGPNLKFGLEFPEPGNYRLFLQVRVAGKDVFVPIDVNVI